MNHLRIRLVFFFMVLSCTYATAQTDSLAKRTVGALNAYANANPIEKVHLHFDRQLYFPGDTIWFKAYVVAGTRHRLSKLSRVLYVELIGPKDSVINRLTLKLNAGTGYGELVLAANAQKGSYRIRAYTNWMRNFGQEYFFDHRLFVSNIVSREKISQQIVNKGSAHNDPKIDLQFFPEGGSLVNGVRSRIAFKAIGPDGLGIQVQGVIVNDVGTEVGTFASQHLGMGSFALNPQKGETYFAKVNLPGAEPITVPLPKAADTGFILSISGATSDSLFVKIVDVNMPDTAFYIMAQSDGRYYVASGDKLKDSKVFRITIPKNIFSTGLVQFTLFSQSGEPVNERLVFVQLDDRVHISVTPDKPQYSPGQPVNFVLDAKDITGIPDLGNFSVSVVDETRVPVIEAAESSIFTDLLLKSEIGGNIEDPNYYFVNTTDEAKIALDLLMLTQGYHRYEWKKMLGTHTWLPKYQPETGALTVAGTVKTSEGKVIAGGKVMLTVARKMMVLDTLTDANGRFVFDNLDLPDTSKVVINAKNVNGGNKVFLTFDKPEYAPVTKFAGPDLYPNSDSLAKTVESAYADWRKDSLDKVIQLKNVDVKNSKIQSSRPGNSDLLKHSANLNGPGVADQVITGDKFGDCTNLAVCLEALTRGQINWQNDIPYNLHKAYELVGPQVPMSFLVDGMFWNINSVYSDINPLDISSVEVLTSDSYSAIYGAQASGGLIIITTKSGGNEGYQPVPQSGLVTYSFKPYYKAREFYSPKYPLNGAALTTDNRKTVYWMPSITTDASGKTSFSFFNAGTPGNYRVVVEGIDENGRLGRLVYHYKVE